MSGDNQEVLEAGPHENVEAKITIPGEDKKKLTYLEKLDLFQERINEKLKELEKFQNDLMSLEKDFFDNRDYGDFVDYGDYGGDGGDDGDDGDDDDVGDDDVDDDDDR